MKCKYCGYELAESSVFCNNCGQKVFVNANDPELYILNNILHFEVKFYDMPVL